MHAEYLIDISVQDSLFCFWLWGMLYKGWPCSEAPTGTWWKKSTQILWENTQQGSKSSNKKQQHCYCGKWRSQFSCGTWAYNQTNLPQNTGSVIYSCFSAIHMPDIGLGCVGKQQPEHRKNTGKQLAFFLCHSLPSVIIWLATYMMRPERENILWAVQKKKKGTSG